MADLHMRDTYGKEVPTGWTSDDDLNVYAFRTSRQVPVRISDGAGDSNFSHMETLEGTYHVAARSVAFAEAAYSRHRPSHVYKRLAGPTAVLIIDAIVDVHKCWNSNC